MEVSALVKAELAATCSTLGRLHAGSYVVDPQCFESVRDLIRYLRRDDAFHEVRLYLGQAKVLQTDLVPIIAASPSNEIFDIVVRLLVNLTNPVILLYKEELPAEKVGRNIYIRLIGYSQEYKTAFCDVEFWRAVCMKLTQLFEVDWAERSEDSSLQIERLLVLLRNVLQVPADTELERRPDNDITVHDKVLWALRESQLLELLLYVSSNKDEEQYFLHLLEIFSLILREQSPGGLASCEIRRSAVEKERDVKELASLREKEKLNTRSFKNTRSFAQTFVLKNVKSISDNEVVYHKSLDKLHDLKLTQDKKRIKTPKNKFPEDSERAERRSTFSVRLFLKEFCIELLSCSFNNLMGVVKDKLVSGKGLSNDESYYFWALKFFLEFSCTANVDIKLISECINVQTFHFVQTQLENCYDHLATDKKKLATWVRRLHLALKAYRSLLQTLMWMDSSSDPKIRDISKVLKSNVFYVVEYRELMLQCLFKYDHGKFPLSFLRDLIETNHLNLKLLEGYCKTNKIVVQKKKRVVKRSSKKKNQPREEVTVETAETKWEKIKDDILEMLEKGSEFPEISPYDAASSVPIDDQKEDAMRNIQKCLRNQQLKQAIGLLRSARQVWPENDYFGNDAMSVEDEVMALQEICLADLGVSYEQPAVPVEPQDDEMDGDDDDDGEQERLAVIEQGFDIQDYIKKLVNKKVVEACCILLGNYKKNSSNTNHCAVKLLHRIGWDCKVPSIMYQASFFITLHKILQEKDPEYKEAQQFARYLFKKFRENAATNPKIYMELLFWKDVKIAIDVESGYGTSETKENRGVWSEEEEDELKRLWVEFDEKMLDVDKVDWIRDNLINQSRSRIGIIKKLKELMLIVPGTKVTKKRKGGAEWTDTEATELAELFAQHKDTMDVVTIIRERMAFARSKKSIRDKLLDMGLVDNLAQLRKKRPRKGRTVNVDDSPDPERVDSSSSSSDEEEAPEGSEPAEKYAFSRQDAIAALKGIEGTKAWLEWLKESYQECLEDEDGCEGFPLLALDTTHSQALEDPQFQHALHKLNMVEPLGDQVYWKMRNESKLDLHERLELIKAALDGTLKDLPEDMLPNSTRGTTANRNISDDSDSEDEFEKLKRVMPAAVNNDKTPLENKKDDPSGMESNDDSDAESTANPQPSSRPLDSDRSDQGGESGEENTSVKKKSRQPATSHPLDSDRSDQGGESGEDVPAKLKGGRRQPGCLASDSEGEDAQPADSWRQKRRRCIGSDSEVEGNPSDDEEGHRPLEVRKKSRMLDSDSDLEGQGSPDDPDIRMSR